MRESVSCSIGVLGTFDTDLFSDALVPRVLRRELKARLPAAEVITFAPYGSLRPTPRDGGEPAESPGGWRQQQCSDGDLGDSRSVRVEPRGAGQLSRDDVVERFGRRKVKNAHADQPRSHPASGFLG